MGINGSDGYNLRNIPFTVDRQKIPHTVGGIVVAAELAESNKVKWDAFVQAYPQKLEDDRFVNTTALIAAMPLTVLWGMAWIALFVSLYSIGLWWTLLWCVALGAPTALAAFGITTVVHAVRFRKRQNPVSKAMELAGEQVGRGMWIAPVFPLYAFPKFGFAALEAYVSVPEPVPEDKDAEALKHMRDTRVQVALALVAGINTVNELAMILRHEVATRRLHAGQDAPQSKVDVPALERLLLGMRETVLRQIEFLQLTHDDAPLGEFRADIAELIAANSERMDRAKGILSDDRDRRGAVVELAQALVGEPARRRQGQAT